MTAMNVVRMRVKAGREDAFIRFHEDRALAPLKGMDRLRLVKTGDREYLVLGHWESMDALATARPAMIAMLDQFRDDLEDLGSGLGVTDPRSGEVVLDRAGCAAPHRTLVRRPASPADVSASRIWINGEG